MPGPAFDSFGLPPPQPQDCKDQMQKSLRCMETGDKDKCADFIESYKACRKAEQDRIREARNPGKGFKW